MPFYDQSAYSAHLRAQTFASRSPVTGLALSPGGTKLASASAAGTLALHDVSGHSAATSTLAPASPMSSWPLRETNVSAVATSRTLLLVAGTAGLRAFSWAALQDAHGKAAEAPSHRLLRAGAVRSVVAGSGCDDLLVVVEDGEVVRFGPDGREADVFAAQPCLDSTNCLARSSRSPEVFMTVCSLPRDSCAFLQELDAKCGFVGLMVSQLVLSIAANVGDGRYANPSLMLTRTSLYVYRTASAKFEGRQ